MQLHCFIPIIFVACIVAKVSFSLSLAVLLLIRHFLRQRSSSARRYDVRQLQSPSFSSDDVFWANSEPVICKDVLSRQQMYLTPAYFMQTFGHEKVDLIDCESGEVKAGTLEDILKLFDSSQDPHDPVWKVKVCASLLHVMKMK